MRRDLNLLTKANSRTAGVFFLTTNTSLSQVLSDMKCKRDVTAWLQVKLKENEEFVSELNHTSGDSHICQLNKTTPGE